ncbi:Hypothetical protein AA314_08122 [Archangium gephyra]|uniref:Uncharacterized protein n=1 Tax=Archangium gephyra TaxID=48 RepID=A0AAC8TJC4_9BACT|nr:Hypothetical protein AA314_08122 [Archangium gephyra]
MEAGGSAGALGAGAAGAGAVGDAATWVRGGAAGAEQATVNTTGPILFKALIHSFREDMLRTPSQ